MFNRHGAGTVQTIIPVGADHALRLTTSFELRPDGKRLVDAPVDPDCPASGTVALEIAVAIAKSGHAACPAVAR